MKTHSKKPLGSLLGRLLFLALLLLLVLLPWPLGLNRDWAWSIALVAAAALTLLVAWKRMREDGADLLWSAPLKLSLAAFAALCVLGVMHFLPTALADGSTVAARWPLLGSVDPSAAYDAWLKRSLYFLLFVLTLTLVRTRERLRLLLITLVVVGFLQAAYGAIMVVSGWEFGFFARKTQSLGMVSGTYINRNHFSNLAVMSAAVGIGYMITLMLATRSQASTWKGHLRELIRAVLSEKGRLRLALVVLVVAIVMTRSRMGNMSFFLSLSVVSAAALMMLRPLPIKIAAFLLSVVAIDVLIVGQLFGIEQVVDRLQGSYQTPAPTVDLAILDPKATQSLDADRRAVIPIALRMWQQRLWFGHGAGGFYTAFPAFRTIDFPGFYDHAHNDYLQFLVEYGAIGTGLILLPVFLALWCAIQLLRVRHDPLLSGTGFGVGMAIVATLIHSSVEFVQQIPANAAILSVLSAAAFAAHRLPRRTAR